MAWFPAVVGNGEDAKLRAYFEIDDVIREAGHRTASKNSMPRCSRQSS